MQVQRQYALKQNFMKIEVQKSIRRLSFLCCLPDIKIAWINPFLNFTILKLKTFQTFGKFQQTKQDLLLKILNCINKK